MSATRDDGHGIDHPAGKHDAARTQLQLVNVNFPAQPTAVEWTRQSVRRYDGAIVPARDPRGNAIFWFASMLVKLITDHGLTPTVVAWLRGA